MAIVSKNVKKTNHFKSPYSRYFSSDSANGLSWEDGFLEYDKLFTVLHESPLNLAHVYCYGTEKRQFLEELLHIPIHDIQPLRCPDPQK